jgi:hypothetical protein
VCSRNVMPPVLRCELPGLCAEPVVDRVYLRVFNTAEQVRHRACALSCVGRCPVVATCFATCVQLPKDVKHFEAGLFKAVVDEVVQYSSAHLTLVKQLMAPTPAAAPSAPTPRALECVEDHARGVTANVA